MIVDKHVRSIISLFQPDYLYAVRLNNSLFVLFVESESVEM